MAVTVATKSFLAMLIRNIFATALVLAFEKMQP